MTTPQFHRPTILVHGWGGSARAWDAVRSHMTPSAAGAVIAVDLPGAPGGDPAPPHTIAAATDLVLAEISRAAAPVTLIGHSLGAQVTLLAHGRAPAAVANEVVVDPAYGADDSSGPAMRAWADIIRRDGHDALDEFFSSALETLPAAIARDVMSTMRATPSQVLADYLLSEYVDPDAIGLLSRTRTAALARVRPVLSLHSTRDSVEREAALPAPDGSASELWRDHGHFLHLEDPARFAALVGEWTRLPSDITRRAIPAI